MSETSIECQADKMPPLIRHHESVEHAGPCDPETMVLDGSPCCQLSEVDDDET